MLYRVKQLMLLALCTALLWPGETRAVTYANEGISVGGDGLALLTTEQSKTDHKKGIRDLQTWLQILGFYRGRVDGTWGPDTKRALDRFLEIARLKGKFDAEKAEILLWAAEIVQSRSAPTQLAIIEAPALIQARKDEAEANALRKAGRYADAERLYATVLLVRETTLAQGHRFTLDAVNNLAVVYTEQGRLDEAERLHARALAGRERLLGADDPATLDSVSNLANVYEAQGRLDEAERLHARALAGRERLLGADDPATLDSVNNLGNVYEAQGRLAEAGLLHARALAGRERLLGAEHPATLDSLNNLAIIYHEQGRLAEAGLLHSRALAGRELVLGAEHPSTLDSVNNLANVYRSQSRHAEAERLYARALTARERVLGAEHPSTLDSVNNLANVYRSQSRHAEAERLYARALTARERVLGAEHPATLDSVNNLANVYWALSRHAEAERLYARALATQERLLGAEHPATLRSANNLALLYSNRNRHSEAVEVWRRSFAALAAYFTYGAARRNTTGGFIVPLSLPQFFTSVIQSDVTSVAKARVSLEGQGWWNFGQLDLALSDLRARSATGGGGRLTATRDFQEAREKLARLQQVFANTFEDAARGARLRSEITLQMKDARGKFEKQRARIERDFPELAEIALPRALKADEAQALLKPGEGLIAYASMEKYLYAWLVTNHIVAWKRFDEPAANLRTLTEGLRASVDMTKAASSAKFDPRCAVSSTVPGMEGRDFDACKSKELYDLVLGGLDLTGLDQLIIVPDGPLETIPFSMLVTGFHADGRPKWLIEDHAISMLPTTSSLRALRQVKAKASDTAQKPYLGIAPVTFGNGDSASPVRSVLEDLPGTENEVRFLSGLLGGGTEGYVTGKAASEGFIKTSALDRYRVLSFATHGLMSKQSVDLTGGKITEPALVLAPSEGEDGLLTATEAAGLRLDADWVLLSGCNTAAGGGDNAEGLSGLARAFFFAGARALLVSHWSIDDNAAMDVMVETMKRAAIDKTLGKAQALRQAMLTVMQKPGYNHPFFWAPFSLIGVENDVVGR